MNRKASKDAARTPAIVCPTGRRGKREEKGRQKNRKKRKTKRKRKDLEVKGMLLDAFIYSADIQ